MSKRGVNYGAYRVKHTNQEPEAPKGGWLKRGIRSNIGVEMFDMTDAEIAKWENRVNVGIGLLVCTGVLGALTYAGIKIVNAVYGVG